MKKMEPLTPLDKEFFKRKNLVDLAGIIATNHACDWHVFPFAQKYYELTWQIFVHKICTAGYWSSLAFNYIGKIKKSYKSNDGGINLEDIIDLQLLKYIDSDFMIIDDNE